MCVYCPPESKSKQLAPSLLATLATRHHICRGACPTAAAGSRTPALAASFPRNILLPPPRQRGMLGSGHLAPHVAAPPPHAAATVAASAAQSLAWEARVPAGGGNGGSLRLYQALQLLCPERYPSQTSAKRPVRRREIWVDGQPATSPAQ